MLAEADAVHADLVGKNGLLDHIPDHLGMGERLAVGTGLDVAEGIHTKLNVLAHQFSHYFRWGPPAQLYLSQQQITTRQPMSSRSLEINRSFGASDPGLQFRRKSAIHRVEQRSPVVNGTVESVSVDFRRLACSARNRMIA